MSLEIVIRERIARQLKALLLLTVERGATQSEAAAAAAKAAEFMRRYELAAGTAPEYVADARPWFPGRLSSGRVRAGRKPATAYALGGIAALCGVECAISEDHGTLMFYGTAPSADAAHDFERVVRKTLTTEWDTYRAEHGTQLGQAGRKQRASFQRGMAERIGRRLAALASTDEIAVRQAEIRRKAFAAEYRVQDGRPSTASDGNAATAGFAAGASAPLARGQADAPTHPPVAIEDESQ